MNRKAQIKMFETVAVLIIFFFLLATGSAFYFGAQQSALKKDKIKASEQYAFQIALKALYLPELDCSFLATQKDNCIDKMKLAKLKQLIQTNSDAYTDYFNTFGYATITITEAWPGQATTTLYNNIPTELKTTDGQQTETPTYTGSIATQSPILLYDAWLDAYAFGIIEVTVYVI